jgi:hypothetical protein
LLNNSDETAGQTAKSRSREAAKPPEKDRRVAAVVGFGGPRDGTSSTSAAAGLLGVGMMMGGQEGAQDS